MNTTTDSGVVFDFAAAGLDQINNHVWSIASDVTEGRLRAIAKEVRCRYREFSFAELLTALIDDKNGIRPLHPLCKRAMFRVMRRHIANLVSDVSRTPFSFCVKNIADIRPAPIKRKECGSPIEDVQDWRELAFDVHDVAEAYLQIVGIARNIVDGIANATNEMLYAVIFLEKHGLVAPDDDRDAAIFREFEMRMRKTLGNLAEADLDTLGTFLSLNANGYISMRDSEYNRFCEAVLAGIINMVHKVAHKFPNLLAQETFEEITNDALAKMFSNLHSYCPAHGKFSTWAWETMYTSMTASYADMTRNRFIINDSSLCKKDAEDGERSIMNTSNSSSLREYEREMLIQHIQSCAEVLIERMPKYTHIIRAVFGDAEGVATDDLDYASIARRSSKIGGVEQSSSYVRNVFEKKIRPEFIRVFG